MNAHRHSAVASLILAALLLGATACQEPAVAPERVSVGAGSPKDVRPETVEPDSVLHDTLGDPRLNAQEPFAGPDGKPVTGHKNVSPDRRPPAEHRSGTDLALEHLSSIQRSDGSWDGSTRTGDLLVTAAATLGFLGFGETHNSGAYKHHVKSALRYIKTRQAEHGGFVPNTTDDERLANVLAGTVLIEAYGMTGSRLFKEQSRAAGRSLIEELSAADFRPSEDPYLALWQLLALVSYQMSELGETDALLADVIKTYRLDERRGEDWAALRLITGYWATRRSREMPDNATEDVAALLERGFAGPSGAPLLTVEQLHLGTMALWHYEDGWERSRKAILSVLEQNQVRDAEAPRRGSWPVTSGRGERFGHAYDTALHQLVYGFFFRHNWRPRGK